MGYLVFKHVNKNISLITGRFFEKKETLTEFAKKLTLQEVQFPPIKYTTKVLQGKLKHAAACAANLIELDDEKNGLSAKNARWTFESYPGVRGSLQPATSVNGTSTILDGVSPMRCAIVCSRDSSCWSYNLIDLGDGRFSCDIMKFLANKHTPDPASTLYKFTHG